MPSSPTVSASEGMTPSSVPGGGRVVSVSGRVKTLPGAHLGFVVHHESSTQHRRWSDPLSEKLCTQMIATEIPSTSIANSWVSQTNASSALR
jgi:hypothetical protein